MKCIENYEGFSKISYNNYSLESKNMKTKRIKRPVCYLVGLLAFGLILYSCLQDETDLDSRETTGKIIKGKNRELSIDMARSWYEAHQTPVVTTRSVVTHFELMTKLHWKKGYENRKGKFEVVEVPLLTRGGAVLMDSETMEKYKETERGKIRNISRMVIIKNLESGEIINFVMHIVGTYDYLMKAKHFEDNSYLYRAPDLSGSVYFYEPEGGLVNGWQYENGKIVATISQGTEEGLKMQATADTRSESSECHYESVFVEYDECTPFIYEDPEYGIGFGIDRMCMLLTGAEAIRDVLLFPTMKSLDAKKGEAKAEKAVAAEVKTEEKTTEKVDFSNVKIEPLFEEMVDFDTFSKSDFRAVKIEACEAVPKSKKLLKFILNDGTDRKRTILSGIHEYYEPEELIGKTAIAIVNLPPRKMMGIDSEGMLISAVHEEDGREGLNLLMVDDRIPAGAKLY